MKVVKRGDIIILKSNLKETSPLFDKAQEYKKGDVVQHNKNLYRAKEDIRGEELDDLYWEQMGSTNEYALFDYFLNTVSKSPDCIDVSFFCMGVQAIYLFGVRARTLEIQIISAQTNEPIEKEIYDLNNTDINSWKEYFFTQKQTKARTIFYERRTLTRNVYIRIIAYGQKSIEISSIIAGQIIDMPTTLYSKNSISMIDFSKIEENEQGHTKLTKGNFKRKNNFEILVEDKDMDRVSYLLEELRAEASVFVISDYFENLIIFGFLKNHEILLEKVGRSIISIEI